jgi:hypothetical protein
MMRATAVLIGLASISLAAQTAPPRPSGDSRITGRVLTSSGDAVEGAEVIAPYFTRNPHAEFIFRALSAADGSFVLDRIPAGRLRVLARKPGYSGMTTNPAAISEGVLVDVDAAGVVSGIDLVLRRTGAIKGRVRRPDGTVVGQAAVSAQLRLPNGRLIGVQPPFMTGADGAFTLTDVPQGSYVVVARYSAMREMIAMPEPLEYQDWAETFHPSTSDFDHATRVEIRGGDSHEPIDITLQPEPRFSVSGVIVDAKGTTPQHALLECGNGSSGSTRKLDPSAAGRFDVGGLRNGPVHLLATSDSPAGPLVGYTVVDVQGASVREVRVELGPAASVRGRVIAEGATLAFTDARIKMSTPWIRSPLFGPKSDSRHEQDSFAIASDGTFTAGPLIGERIVDIIGLPASWQLKEVRRRGAVVLERRLTLANGQVIDDLDVIVSARN